MKSDLVRLALGALALAGLMAVNTALPAEAGVCEQCWEFPGWPPGCLGGQQTGYMLCHAVQGGCNLLHECYDIEG